MAKAPPKPIRLLMVDDHRIVRDGLRAMLNLFSDSFLFEIDEAENGEEALKLASAHSYEIGLIDYHLPDREGSKITELILRKRKEMAILGLSSYDETSYVEEMMKAGAKGYILKNIEPDTLLMAFKTILRGGTFFSNEISQKLLAPVSIRNIRTSGKRLSLREKEIARLIASGLTNQQVADTLHLSKRTIDTHRDNLMSKLDVHNAVELARALLRLGL
jgi:DNA-binding NarL/FixJ family response regulator